MKHQDRKHPYPIIDRPALILPRKPAYYVYVADGMLIATPDPCANGRLIATISTTEIARAVSDMVRIKI